MHPRAPRLLICSLAVPWPDRVTQGLYNLHQASALASIGFQTEIWSPAPAIGSELLDRRWVLHPTRPQSYEIEGIRIHAPHVPFGFPQAVRHRLAPFAPWSTARWMKWAVEFPLMRAVQELVPDALLIHGTMPWGPVALEIAQTKIPFGIIEHSWGDVMRLAPRSRLTRFYRSIGQQAKAVLAVSQPMVATLQERLGLNNVQLVENGVVEVPLPDEPRPVEFGSGPLIVSAANYYRRKGFEELLKAFEALADKDRPGTLVLITNGCADLRRRIQRSKHAARIRLWNGMPHSELQRWLAWADLYALPSWSEAFGITYAESLRAGTAVLMTEDCGLANALPLSTSQERDGNAVGWRVRPRDVDDLRNALDQAVSNLAETRAMGRRGIALARDRFSWRSNARSVATALGLEDLAANFLAYNRRAQAA